MACVNTKNLCYVFPKRQELVSELDFDVVTLEYIKQVLRRDPDDTSFDDTLNVYIESAIDIIEAWTGLILRQQTLKAYNDCFPAGFKLNPINPYNSVYTSVTSVQYIDTDDNTQTLDTGAYNVTTFEYYTRVIFYGVDAFNDPSDRNCEIPDSVIINYTSGYPDADSIPDEIKAAIGIIVSGLFYSGTCEGSAEYGDCIPCPAKTLLRKYKPSHFRKI